MKVTMGTMSRSMQKGVRDRADLRVVQDMVGECFDHKLALDSLPKFLQVFILWSSRSHNDPVCATMRHS